MLQLKLPNQPCTVRLRILLPGFTPNVCFGGRVLHVPRFGRQGLGSKKLQDYNQGTRKKGTTGQEREKRTDKRQDRQGELIEGCPVKTPSWPFCTQKRVLPRHVVRKLVEKGHARTSAAQPIQSAP